MKNKMGWNTTELKKPYDSFAAEFQQRVRNACNPAPRSRVNKVSKPRKSLSLTPGMHGTPTAYSSPHVGYMASPQLRDPGINSPTGYPGPVAGRFNGPAVPSSAVPSSSAPRAPSSASGAGSNAADPMDLS